MCKARHAFEIELMLWTRRGIKGSFRKSPDRDFLLRICSRDKKKFVHKLAKIWKVTIESETIAQDFREFSKLYQLPMKINHDTEAIHLSVIVPKDVLNSLKPELQNPKKDGLYRFFIKFQVDVESKQFPPELKLVLTDIQEPTRGEAKK